MADFFWVSLFYH